MFCVGLFFCERRRGTRCKRRKGEGECAKRRVLEANLISLAVLGLSSKVDDDVELGAGLLEGESAVDTGIRGEVALLVVDDGVGESSSVGSTEEGGGREDLVDDTNVRAEVALDEVGHEIAANEANSSKNENLRFSSHVVCFFFLLCCGCVCVLWLLYLQPNSLLLLLPRTKGGRRWVLWNKKKKNNHKPAFVCAAKAKGPTKQRAPSPKNAQQNASKNEQGRKTKGTHPRHGHQSQRAKDKIRTRRGHWSV